MRKEQLMASQRVKGAARKKNEAGIQAQIAGQGKEAHHLKGEV
jgi:hypothetical protein